MGSTVAAIALFLSGVAHAAIPKNAKRGLNHGGNERPSNGQTEAILPNHQSGSYESSAQFHRQSSQEETQPLPTPGIPPSFLSFSATEERANTAVSQRQRTAPFLDEDRNSVIQDSAVAAPSRPPTFDAPNIEQDVPGAPPSPPQFDAPNIEQGESVTQSGPTETVVSTGTAPPEGTVIGAPYLIAVHRYITRRYGIPVAKPYPVKVPKDVQILIENPVPYKVDKPYTVQVIVPKPYAVDRPYPVPVDRPYPVRVPQPVGVRVPQPVGVPVPHPYPVQVPTSVDFAHSAPLSPAPVALTSHIR